MLKDWNFLKTKYAAAWCKILQLKQWIFRTIQKIHNRDNMEQYIRIAMEGKLFMQTSWSKLMVLNFIFYILILIFFSHWKPWFGAAETFFALFWITLKLWKCPMWWYTRFWWTFFRRPLVLLDFFSGRLFLVDVWLVIFFGRRFLVDVLLVIFFGGHNLNNLF